MRSHGAIPVPDAAEHRLRIEGLVAKLLELSLDELQSRFPAVSVVAIMHCAGNRRADMQRVRPVSGDPWGPGAIGNAEWTGVSLTAVLRTAGAEMDPALHVAFQSADECHLEASPSLRRIDPDAQGNSGGVTAGLRHEREKLEAEHGAPLRVVVPGHTGVRSPKWLQTITVQDQPSDNPIQVDDYKLFPPDVPAVTADPAKGMTINPTAR